MSSAQPAARAAVGRSSSLVPSSRQCCFRPSPWPPRRPPRLGWTATANRKCASSAKTRQRESKQHRSMQRDAEKGKLLRTHASEVDFIAADLPRRLRARNKDEQPRSARVLGDGSAVKRPYYCTVMCTFPASKLAHHVPVQGVSSTRGGPIRSSSHGCVACVVLGLEHAP